MISTHFLSCLWLCQFTRVRLASLICSSFEYRKKHVPSPLSIWAGIAFYKAHFANLQLILCPRHTGFPKELWFSSGLAAFWEPLSLYNSYNSFAPVSPRPITERRLQIVPINSINLSTFWIFILYSWEGVQLAGCECASLVPSESQQVFSSKLEAEIAGCQSIPGNGIFFWLGSMSCARGLLCKNAETQFLAVFIGRRLWICTYRTTSGLESIWSHLNLLLKSRASFGQIYKIDVR